MIKFPTLLFSAANIINAMDLSCCSLGTLNVGRNIVECCRALFFMISSFRSEIRFISAVMLLSLNYSFNSSGRVLFCLGWYRLPFFDWAWRRLFQSSPFLLAGWGNWSIQPPFITALCPLNKISAKRGSFSLVALVAGPYAHKKLSNNSR
jgi:hypothetical protein